MTVTGAQRVSDVAIQVREAIGVFEAFGIDYCGGAERSLHDACSAAGVPVDAVILKIDQARTGSSPVILRDWSAASLSELISHIIRTHHAFVRDEILKLSHLAREVVAAHADRHPELRSIRQRFEVMAQELDPHMFKEEQILFPYIGMLEEGARCNQAIRAPFGSVRNPIQMMLQEHEVAHQLMREIRAASSAYAVPDDGCAKYRAFYEGLDAFDRDLHLHIHLENNILFPRALDIEELLERATG